ncbi:unnamed protein product [Protopolystoma xenopodis]|uniref:Bicarbonate transporter-like transmembrane domain-containing protein n=1 Tax=Protopolystoma xenopodis TaxID=117903 RepID=A0A3S5BKQ8_9PLAT|nr:unnamed protein product [Protopolystoma xenopodis]
MVLFLFSAYFKKYPIVMVALSRFDVYSGLIIEWISSFLRLATSFAYFSGHFLTVQQRRGWFVWPFSGNPWWTSLVAIGPALLAVILIFMDQQITAVIVNRRENKLEASTSFLFQRLP